MAIETELKFRADGPAPLERLAQLERLGHAVLGPPRTRHETDRYLDTADGRLAAAAWACRLRTGAGRTIVSLKGPLETDASDGAELHRRPEVEGPAGPGADPRGWPPSAARDLLLELSDAQALVEGLVLHQERTERGVRLRRPVGTLSLDHVTVEADGATVGELHIVELELRNGRADVRPLTAALAEVEGLRPDPETKLEHALAIAEGARAHDRPPGAGYAARGWPRRLATTLAGIQPLELVAVLAGLAVFGYLGWDGALWDARLQLVLHLLAIGAVGGLVALWRRGSPLPHLALATPVVALLVAYALGSLVGENRGLALPALAAVVASAAMLPVAFVLLRRRPSWTALVVTVPILLLAAGSLVAMLGHRLAWYLAGGPGIVPPVRIGGEGTPFGSVAVPPFVILMALPLTLLIGPRVVRRSIQAGLLIVGVPLTLLSGSRSAWLAIGVSVLVLGLPMIRRVSLPARWSAGRLAVGAAGVALAGVAIVFIAPRFTAFTSILYRAYLWRDTLEAWATNPLLGIGPGTMPYARMAAAAPLSIPVRQPHSHDLALGVLGDAGLIGLAASAVVVVAFVVAAGPWRSRSFTGRAAFAALAGVGVAGLFEDLTFLPNVNLLIVLLAAVALADAGVVRWRRLRLPRSLVLGLALGGSGLLVGMVFNDAAAVAYRNGIDASADYRWPQAQAWFEQAVALDPWHPAGPKALAIAAEGNGNLPLARDAAARATQLSPGDSLNWTNLAILCYRLGDRPCALRAAGRAVDTTTLGGRELFNAALIYDRLGQLAEADRAYRLALFTYPYTSLASSWPRPILFPETGTFVSEQLTTQAAELNALLARRVLGQRVDPAAYTDAAVRALAASMAGERSVARAALAQAMRDETDATLTWEIAPLLQRHWGEDPARALAIGAVLRGGPLADRPPQGPSISYDVTSFRAYPRDGLIGDAARLFPARPWPWALEPLLAPAG